MSWNSLSTTINTRAHLDRKVLTIAETLTLYILSWHQNLATGRCDPSAETLARETGQEESNTRRTLRSLEQKGFVIRHPRGRNPLDPSRNLSTEYEIVTQSQRQGEVRNSDSDHAESHPVKMPSSPCQKGHFHPVMVTPEPSTEPNTYRTVNTKPRSFASTAG